MPTPCAEVFALTGATAASPEPTTVVNRAMILLVVLIVILGLFLMVVALLSVSRRARTRRMMQQTDTAALKDPWREAGKRIEPFNEGGPVEGGDDDAPPGSAPEES